MDLVGKVQTELPFWLRIMKEHAFFLELGFPAGRESLAKRAGRFVLIFDELLTRAQLVRDHRSAQQLIEDTKTATGAL